jgi:hypothetical protein
MTLNLVRRSTKGAPLTALDHDGNLDKLEGAIETHEAAVNPHPQYLTEAEGDNRYATAAQGAKADTAVQPAALASGLAGKADLNDSRFSDSRTPTSHKSSHAIGGSDALTPADIGAATAAQGDLAASAVQPSDSRLSDAREWSAETISQAEAEEGTSSTRRAFTALRVFQAAAAWWQGASTAAGRALVTAANAAAQRTALGLGTAATTDATAYATAAQGAKADSAVQPGSLAAVATSGSYGDLSNKPTIPTPADAAPLGPGTAAIGTSNDYAREDHVHPPPAVVSTSAAGLAPATSFAAITYAATVNLDLSALDGQVRTITLTGDLTLTNSNGAAGRTVVIRLLPGASQRTLTFPTGWVFYSDKPATIAANKGAVLSLTYFGTADTDCVAVYKQQP